MSKIFYHIILNTSQTQADAVTGILYSHSCLGLEETDNKDSVQLKAYFPNQKKRIDALSAELKKKFPNLTTEISTVDMASLQFQPKPFEPIEIAPSIWVVPPADLETTGGVARSVACGVLLGAPTGTRRDRTRSCPHITITIRPGMAFGTGRHESSQLCAQAICEIKNPQSKTLLDVGTGSGILVILAHQRGFKKVDAVEIDPDARQNTLENFELNKIHDIQLFENIDSVTKKYDIVVANIDPPTLISLHDKLLDCLKPKGILILSGITQEQSKTIEKTFKNLQPKQKKNLGEWWCYIYGYYIGYKGAVIRCPAL
ncbi:MAG: hypothetical protein A2W61_07645 [Deltaproteobacteria bacterium RIFCSPLOWO2_01_44_7]|nr:MAG: hypothetical protein A2712_04325 [Deltaproteobacteria bacterium RIFCSPHIGHO2_01_FULL_43_49]OGQ16410.1 MAG: hypothetical protein A3D22_02290 [Deltaproteobacteria bacterium RIFCSPHIGHO2_02_FULL_44_53]OGQ27763.1 MAG: hypothetical protein A3D98_08695 [Deltaproteobacteria bacterium RIFCSPHIGHO2_12_FULL_44_21]OGQ32928.1 MAG: hypothetical protein A2979_10220 [Deltaproteobacteria bacterium RIFCSPLOWO2_01_FULL_45_74]OGQ38699.1 MAG: hypothetical protein A2W61_07645 [Deltaproteobacteria bacterium 